MKTAIKSIAIGKSKIYTIRENSFRSAYKKDQFLETVNVTYQGIEGDEQVDKRFHGGIDKAIHIGSYKHLKSNEDFDKLSIGCNILVDSIDENHVCLGDVFSLGTVTFVVTQPRQACWKIAAIFGKEVSRYIFSNHATGWYVRVIKEGTINIDDEMQLVKRKSKITMKQMNEYLINPPEDKKTIDEILDSVSLADSYRRDFLNVLAQNNS